VPIYTGCCLVDSLHVIGRQGQGADMKLTALGEFAVRQLTLRCRFLWLPPCSCYSHSRSDLVLLSCDARSRAVASSARLSHPHSTHLFRSFLSYLLPPPKSVLRLCFAIATYLLQPPSCAIRWFPRCTTPLKFGVDIVFADTCIQMAA
jgi:hypothetical protein